MDKSDPTGFKRLGLQLVGAVRTQFGSGVTSKTTAVMVAWIAGFVAICVWMPDSYYKPLALLVLTLFCGFWLNGTWNHTSASPLNAAEGEHLVELYKTTVAAKGIIIVPDAPAVANSHFTAISGGPEGGANG